MIPKLTTPTGDGFYMPAERAPHRGCVMIWPVRPGTWPHAGSQAQTAWVEVACAIAQSETVWMLAAPADVPAAEAAFADWNARVQATCGQEGCDVAGPCPVRILAIETDDAWARDIGPTCVVSDTGEVRGIDWQFNAWGGTYGGLYASWEADQMAASRICDALGLACYDARHFVLEGGAICSDGEGTILATEACLLSPGRNPQLCKEEIEQTLLTYLGAQKVIWLPRGIWQDETNEHVDNICAFVGPAEVVLAWTDDPDDPQYALSLASLRALEAATDAKGRPIRVHKLPVPAQPICVAQAEADAIAAAPGEEVRRAGERLAASYVNFYLSNRGVIVPQFGDAHDAVAVQILAELFPERIVYPIDARPILIGGGNIHCITQNIPKRSTTGRSKEK